MPVNLSVRRAQLCLIYLEFYCFCGNVFFWICAAISARSRWHGYIEDIDNSGHLWRKPYCCCCMQLQLLPLTKVKNGSLSVFRFTFVALRSPARPFRISWPLSVKASLLNDVCERRGGNNGGADSRMGQLQNWHVRLGPQTRVLSHKTHVRRTSISACRVCGVQGIEIGCVVGTGKESFTSPSTLLVSSSVGSHISALIVLVHHSAVGRKRGALRTCLCPPALPAQMIGSDKKEVGRVAW